MATATTLAAPVWAEVVVLGAAAALALAASAGLARCLERVGARLGLSEAMLGLAAALAANGPEITSAVTAMARHQRQVGAGVVLGSNVFNVAALLGLGAVVAGRIRLHGRVIALSGVVALWVALVALGTSGSLFPAGAGLLLALVAFGPYVVVCGWPRTARRLGVPERASRWLEQAVFEEEAELREAILPGRGDRRDVVLGVGALAVVIGSSILMEGAATGVGHHFGVPDLVIGAVLLAAVTSLPNAVAGAYLARRGRGAAVLSEALNSNNLNVVLGLLVPASIVGVASDGGAVLVAAFALALTALALALAGVRRALRRLDGSMILAGYAAYLAALITFLMVR